MTKDIKCYLAPKTEFWTGRQDSPLAERFYQHVQCVDIHKQKLPAKSQKQAVGFVGFCSEEGIKRNMGRLGSRKGPEEIRKHLSNLAFHFDDVRLYDFGDITCRNGSLETAQQQLAKLVNELLQKNIKPILLGGGHEIAWGHYQGIHQAFPKENIGIINFDAHFDLRPVLEGGKGTSGSSFLQIAEHCKQELKEFNYFCIGIQQASNTSSLFKTAKQLGTEVIFADEIHNSPPETFFHQIDEFVAQCDKLYVTVCLDVLATAFAPGVSAPQALGLQPWQVIAILQHLAHSDKLISFDIAELSPPHDMNGMTASLAAGLVSEFLHEWV